MSGGERLFSPSGRERNKKKAKIFLGGFGISLCVCVYVLSVCVCARLSFVFCESFLCVSFGLCQPFVVSVDSVACL